MTILIKIVLLPLTHVSHVSMQKMQEVNPKAQAIRAKYRGKLRDKDGRFNVENQRRMNEEMQAVYSEAGVNPMSGCLPMLAQIPIFFAYFRLLPLAIELRMAPWLGWIQDLSAADPYFLLPVIMGVTQVIQMKLTPQASDPIQRRIMQLFPIVFTVFSLGFPSGLVLYWLTNNIFTIGQIWTYNRIKAAKAAK
jgi:YidC/Oxa1 family membrane protein insertase